MPKFKVWCDVSVIKYNTHQEVEVEAEDEDDLQYIMHNTFTLEEIIADKLGEDQDAIQINDRQ